MATESSDGQSSWIEGVQLLSVYAVFGILFHFLPKVQSTVETFVPRH
jgi:Ca2+/H+ antiporter